MLLAQTAAVLDGHEHERSGVHFAYVALELVKVTAPIWTGVLLIDGW